MKRILTFLCVLALLACCLPVRAAEASDALPYVCDTALLLNDEEWLQMEEWAEELSDRYQCAVYFITVDDYRNYGSGSIYDVAKRIYTAYSLGWGQEKSGVLLLLSMDDRDYTLIAYGYGNTAFTDYGKDYLSQQFLDDFSSDDWAGGCRDYLNTCGQMLEMARSGNPLDVRSRVKAWHLTAISLLLGFALAYAICSVWRRSCRKKTGIKYEASSYLAPGGMNITLRKDRYTHTTQARTKIESPPNKSGSSSGGTTVDRQGFSGKSGKF